MKPGLLVISHGSRDGSWVTLVDEAIAKAAWPEGVPIASSFLECVPNRTIQDGIDALEAQGVDHIGVIPLFVSAGSTHVDEIAYALGVTAAPLAETGLAPFRVNARVLYGRPLDGGTVAADLGEASGEWPGLADSKEANGGAGGDAARALGGADDAEEDILLRMVEARLRGLGVRPGADGVLLVAHGSQHEPFQARWHDSLRGLARLLVKRGMCAAASHALLCCEDVAAAAQRLMSLLGGTADGFGERAEKLAAPFPMFDTAPSLGADDELGNHAVKRRVAMVPVFLSRGYFTTHVIPERLADVPVMYDGQTLLPHPALGRWLEREAERLLAMLAGRLKD